MLISKFSGLYIPWAVCPTACGSITKAVHGQFQTIWQIGRIMPVCLSVHCSPRGWRGPRPLAPVAVICVRQLIVIVGSLDRRASGINVSSPRCLEAHSSSQGSIGAARVGPTAHYMSFNVTLYCTLVGSQPKIWLASYIKEWHTRAERLEDVGLGAKVS